MLQMKKLKHQVMDYDTRSIKLYGRFRTWPDCLTVKLSYLVQMGQKWTLSYIKGSACF